METQFYMYTIFNTAISPSGCRTFMRTHYVVGARGIEDARHFIQEAIGEPLIFHISPTTLDIIDKLESEKEGHIVIWI